MDIQANIPELERKVMGLYTGTPLATRAYLNIRIRNYPRLMWNHLTGLEGTFLSLGAGYAVLEAMTALLNPRMQIVASDRNAERITIAKDALKSIPNLVMEVVNLEHNFPKARYDGVLLLDVLHHLSPDIQQAVLSDCVAGLAEKGTLIIKECGTKPSWKKWVNYLNDAIGAPLEKTHPRSEQEWAESLKALGLEPRTVRVDQSSPYAHILVMAKKPR